MKNLMGEERVIISSMLKEFLKQKSISDSCLFGFPAYWKICSAKYTWIASTIILK